MTEEEFFTLGNRYRYVHWSSEDNGYYEVMGIVTIDAGGRRQRMRSRDGHEYDYYIRAFEPFDEWILISGTREKKERKMTGFGKFLKEHGL